MRFDLDPTPIKALIIGILLFMESLCGGVLIILQRSEMPNLIEVLTVLMVAALTLITYLLAFVRQGEAEA